MENNNSDTSSVRALMAKQKLVSINRTAALSSQKMSDIDRWIATLKSCECIKEGEVRELCNLARDILLQESNV